MKQNFSPSKRQLDRFEAISKLTIDVTRDILRVKYNAFMQQDSESFDKGLDKAEKELEVEKKRRGKTK